MTEPGDWWRARPATPAQIALLARHHIVPDAEMRNLTRGVASDAIDTFQQERRTKQDTKPGAPTPAQLRYLDKLMEELGVSRAELPADLNKKSASVLISSLRDQQKEEPRVDEGLYLLDQVVYRVKRSSAGHLHVLKLVKLTEEEYVSNGVRHFKFQHSPTTMRLLRPEYAMTRAQAEEFGQLTGTCCRCGAELDPNIKRPDGSPRYIGPECEKQLGWA